MASKFWNSLLVSLVNNPTDLNLSPNSKRTCSTNITGRYLFLLKLLWFNAVSGCLLYLTKQLISVWLGLCYNLNAGYGQNYFKLICLRSDQIDSG